MHLDDAAAVAKARGGDEEAFRVLVERHSRSIYRLAYRMTGRPEDAEDVVQETFVRAYRRLARFESRSNFATWLYRIGFNCAIDYMRGRPHRESVEPQDTLERLAPGSSGPTVDDLVFAGQVGSRVQQALGELSAQERAAFLMRHYQGCTIEEICHALELKTNAAKHSIFRAVKKMRVALRPLLDGAATPDEVLK
ncbi:MAG: sigma-70 family RNA polymerase sigma factor [Vicinamibacterales bacterium]